VHAFGCPTVAEGEHGPVALEEGEGFVSEDGSDGGGGEVDVLRVRWGRVDGGVGVEHAGAYHGWFVCFITIRITIFFAIVAIQFPIHVINGKTARLSYFRCMGIGLYGLFEYGYGSCGTDGS